MKKKRKPSAIVFPVVTYTIAQAAKILGMDDQTARNIVAREKLGKKIDGKRRLTEDEVRRLPSLVRKRGRKKKSEK